MLDDDDKKWLLERFASKSELHSLSDSLRNSIDARFENLLLRMEIMQGLLTEFRILAERSELRRSGEASRMRALEVRVDTVEERLRKLEEK